MTLKQPALTMALFAGLGLNGIGDTHALAILDFTDATCVSVSSCTNGQSISQEYGDVAGAVEVTWDGNRTTATTDNVFYWGPGYEDLPAVAYGTLNGGGMSILFQALSGWEVNVSSFSIAPYSNRVRNSSVRVVADSTDLLNTGTFEVSTASKTQYSLGNTWAQNFFIELGPDAWDIGISQITYDWRQVQQQPTDPNQVPTPGTLVLLGASLLGLGYLRRSR